MVCIDVTKKYVKGCPLTYRKAPDFTAKDFKKNLYNEILMFSLSHGDGHLVMY